ncbi:MAG: hypothetical protein LAO07_13595 [Acidobacteriia bacterium]|nr:hypothetical protein [Terriglobia bacterium]
MMNWFGVAIEFLIGTAPNFLQAGIGTGISPGDLPMMNTEQSVTLPPQAILDAARTNA